MSTPMNPVFARKLIERPGTEVTDELFKNAAGVFWVDWREGSDDIVRLAARAMGDVDLAPLWVGDQLHVRFRGAQTRVPLSQKPGEQHLTLRTLNTAIAAEFEIRFIKASDGGDTLAFMPLPNAEWAKLDAAFGAKVDDAFGKLGDADPFGHDQPMSADAMQQTKAQMKFLRFARTHFRVLSKADATVLKATPGSVVESLFGDLSLTYFDDLRPTFPLVNAKDLEEYSTTREELHGISLKNLFKVIPSYKFFKRAGVYEIVGAGEMTSGAAIHHPLWDAMEREHGPLVVAFARRDLVLFVPAADQSAIVELRAALKRLDFKDPLALSRNLHQRLANTWHVY